MSTTPKLAEVLRAALAAQQAEIHTTMPGEIQKYDKATQRAEIRVGVKRPVAKEDGSAPLEEFSILPSVPIIFPSGGGFRAIFPMAQGDPVLVHFSSISIGRWLANGGVVDPEHFDRHLLADAVATPGLQPKQKAWSTADANDASFGADGGPQYVAKANELHLGAKSGSDATEAVLLGSKFTTDLDQMLQNMSTAITSMSAKLTIIATLTQVAATAAAVPMVGGIAALPSWVGVVAQLGLLMTDVTQLGTYLTQFSAASSTRKSTIVKTK